MLDFDSLREIGTTLKKNKLRTFLTGFSIAWGIFMLIFLLGAGNGLANGIRSNFAGRAINSISVWPGVTSIPYKGLTSDRPIQLTERDLAMIKTLPEVEHISGEISRTGIISYDKEYSSWNIVGIHPGARHIKKIEILPGNGRFINDIDINRKRKVIVISTDVQDVLFKGEEALGKYVIADNIAFQVVGIYKDETGKTNVPSFIPFSTAQGLYNNYYGMQRLDFTVKDLNTMEANEDFIERFRQKMGALHSFDPKDTSAVYLWNNAANAVSSAEIFRAVQLFTWIVGMFSLIAGIVGVGNIMAITIKERTKEFGIRKAIGAKPMSILGLVLLESVLITASFGYVGMLIGVGVTEVANIMSENMIANNEPGTPVIFSDPTVDITIVFQATLVLIVAGVVAGGIPALRAVKISPIEAMRAD